MTEHSDDPRDAARRTALVVIDMQRDYFEDDELQRCRADLVATVNRLTRLALAAGAPVLVVRTEHRPDRSTWTLSMLEDDRGIAIAGSEGAELLEELEVSGTEQVVKTRDSSFFGTDLRERLARHDVAHLVLVGVSTESCIAATAVDAFAHDLAVTLVEDGTASVQWSLHDETLERLHRQYRQEVASADDVARIWRADG